MFKKLFSQLTPMQQQPETFQYEHLQPGSIRLLQIVAHDADLDIVAYSLATFEFPNCPPYTALSYTWGSPRQTANITVNKQIIKIRKNLLAFLEEAGKSVENSDRLFWIDQICINQRDIKERNDQVAQMGRIYREAANTIIWLGQESSWDDSNLAMRMIPDLAQRIRDQDRGKEELGEEASREDAPKEEDQGDEDTGKQKTKKDRILLSKDQGYSVIRLLRRPYWSRLWIVQEISLSRDIEVWCGSMRVDFDAIGAFLRALPLWLRTSKDPDTAVGLHFYVPQATQTMFYNRVERVGELATYSVMAACMFADQQCHDPRDKIYGLLGIIADEHKIAVDYSKSNTKVFMDVVNWWLIDNTDNEGNLNDILDAGQAMDVLRRDKQRQRITQRIEAHPGQQLSARDMDGLI